MAGRAVATIMPFQWVLGLVNAVSAPAKAIKADLSELVKISNSLEAKWNSLRDLALGAIGIYTLDQAFDKLKDTVQQFNTEWTQLGHILGSDLLATNVQDWIGNLTSNLPIVREDLIDITREARKFNVDVRGLPIENIMSSTYVTGKNIVSVFGEISSLTQQMYVQYKDAVSASISLTGTTKHAGEIMAAMGKGAWNSAERFNALAQVIGNAVPDAIERQKQSIEGLNTMLNSMWTEFKRSLLGDNYSGLMKGYRDTLQELYEYLHDRMPKIKELFKGVGEVLGSFLGFFTDIGKVVVNRMRDLLGGLTTNIKDFHKDIILPFVTYVEMVKVRVTALIDGFLKGFLGSPVWTVFKRVIQFIASTFSKIAEFFGILTGQGNNVIRMWESMGSILGTVASLYVGVWVAMKGFKIIATVTSAIKSQLMIFKALSKVFINSTRDVKTNVKALLVYNNVLRTTQTGWSSTRRIANVFVTGVQSMAGVFKNAMRSMKVAFMGNPIGLLIVGITTAIELLSNFHSKADQFREKMKEIKRDVTAQYVEERLEAKKLFEESLNLNTSSTRRKALIEEMNTRLGTHIPLLHNEKDQIAAIKEVYEDYPAKLLAVIEAKKKQELVEQMITDHLQKQQEIESARTGADLGFFGKLWKTTLATMMDIGRGFGTGTSVNSMMQLTEHRVENIRQEDIEQLKSNQEAIKQLQGVIQDLLKNPEMQSIFSNSTVVNNTTNALPPVAGTTGNGTQLTVQTINTIEGAVVGESVKKYETKQNTRAGVVTLNSSMK